MKALWLALRMPTLGIDAVWSRRLRSALPEALAVQEQNRIWQVNPAAERLGIAIGMRTADARARSPSLLMAERQPARERELAEAVALAMQAVTPQLAWPADDLLLLEVGGSVRLFGGVRPLIREVRHGLAGQPLDTVMALAPSARGAALLGRARRGARRRVLSQASLRRELDRLPWDLLPEALPHAEWLDNLGCRTLGGLGRLPQAGLRRRAGEELLQALEEAYGARPQPLAWWQPPAHFRQRFEPFYPLLEVPQVLEVAGLLLRQLCAWLAARHGRVGRCVLGFHYESGRAGRPPDHLPVALAEPDWQFDAWWRVLAEALQRHALPAPVIALELSAGPALARPKPSETLFADPADDRDALALLDLLVARLGASAVRQPAPQPDYRPERANVWLPVSEAPHGVAVFPPPGMPARRPPWLLDAPQPLSVVAGRPAREGVPLRLLAGPERLETAWWEGRLQARDYFVAQDANGDRCWIFRERGTSVGRGSAPGMEKNDASPWWLHGWFG